MRKFVDPLSVSRETRDQNRFAKKREIATGNVHDEIKLIRDDIEDLIKNLTDLWVRNNPSIPGKDNSTPFDILTSFKEDFINYLKEIENRDYIQEYLDFDDGNMLEFGGRCNPSGLCYFNETVTNKYYITLRSKNYNDIYKNHSDPRLSTPSFFMGRIIIEQTYYQKSRWGNVPDSTEWSNLKHSVSVDVDYNDSNDFSKDLRLLTDSSRSTINDIKKVIKKLKNMYK